METLTDQEINEKLETFPNWERDENTIQREFSVSDFVEAVDLVNAFVDPAEEQNHHPDLEVSWGTVVVNFTTHDAGGLTERDFRLASEYNQIFEEDFS